MYIFHRYLYYQYRVSYWIRTHQKTGYYSTCMLIGCTLPPYRYMYYGGSATVLAGAAPRLSTDAEVLGKMLRVTRASDFRVA